MDSKLARLAQDLELTASIESNSDSKELPFEESLFILSGKNFSVAQAMRKANAARVYEWLLCLKKDVQRHEAQQHEKQLDSELDRFIEKHYG